MWTFQVNLIQLHKQNKISLLLPVEGEGIHPPSFPSDISSKFFFRIYEGFFLSLLSYYF